MINDFLIEYLNEECNAGLSHDVSVHEHTISGNDVTVVIDLNPNDMYSDTKDFNVDLIDLMAFIYKKEKENE